MPASDFMPAQAFKPMLPLQWRGGKSGAEKNHTVSSVVFFYAQSRAEELRRKAAQGYFFLTPPVE